MQINRIDQIQSVTVCQLVVKSVGQDQHIADRINAQAVAVHLVIHNNPQQQIKIRICVFRHIHI